MRMIYFIVGVALCFLVGEPARAQGQLEVCRGGDSTCQTPGTIALSCFTSASRRGSVSEGLSGEGMRVSGGRWQLYFADGGSRPECKAVLTAKPVTVGRNDQRGDLKICWGGDRQCQRRSMVGLACLLESQATAFPAAWAYSGDGMRVVRGQWMMYYAHTSQAHICKAVVIGDLGSSKIGDELQICGGNDRRCQGEENVAIACDLDGDRFENPRAWHYNGRAMTVVRGAWHAGFPNNDRRRCRNVVVAKVAGLRPPPRPSPGRGALPSGAVILFDGARCPRGWEDIGAVRSPRSPVSGMSYCRLN